MGRWYAVMCSGGCEYQSVIQEGLEGGGSLWQNGKRKAEFSYSKGIYELICWSYFLI